MFALELRFLTGRYVASSFNDRHSPEWPPHPARLFSALVATHFDTDQLDQAERSALEWLESLGPPELSASAAFPRDDYASFVPVNDITVIGDFNRQESLLADADAALLEQRRQWEASAVHDPKQRAKLEKSLQKAQAKAESAREKLRAAVATRIEIPSKIGKGDYARAAALLPDRRVRQPRRFPGVTPESDVVQFVWPHVESAKYSEALDRLAARLVRLGHSSSLVSLRVIREALPTNYLPVDNGPMRLRVVQAGQLRRLETAFALHRETEPRIMPKAFQDYAPHAEPAPAVSETVFGEDWLVLEQCSGPLLPATRGPDVARAVRGALFAHTVGPMSEILTGHQANGAPSRSPHVAIVPLPFVGHHYADGLLRGVAVVLPRHLGLEEKKVVYRALRGWEESIRASGDDSYAPALPLRLGEFGVLSLRRVDHISRLHALRPDTWCHASRAWVSVSPVALDRNPGDLRSHNPDQLATAIRTAEQIIREACGRIGLPQPVNVEILPFAPLAGVYKAKRYAPFPRDESRTQRVLTHVYIKFDKPVRGPVILCAGRFVGLGLCKPLVRNAE